MKNKIKIIIGLCGLLCGLVLLLSFGVGRSYSSSLEQDEKEAYENRKEVKELSSKAQKASYAAGLTNPCFIIHNNVEKQSLPLFYTVITKPENIFYYWGQGVAGNIQDLWQNQSNTRNLHLNAEAFVAGLSQTSEKKIKVPALSGNAGSEYLYQSSAPFSGANGVNGQETEIVEVVEAEE